MNIEPIRTKADYEKALAFIESNFNARPNTKKGRTVEVLAILVETYEDEHFPIEAPTPVEAIKFRMEQLGMSNTDLAKIIGTRARVSEIFSGKRNLSVRMMRVLHRKLQVPAEVLLSD
ncbi:MAG TPA: helix-turn-helix domain-containing protein [Bacteroidota bacterium]|nr:helix-turn-helix domain-containing protein [Bacteroidota bacterium]